MFPLDLFYGRLLKNGVSTLEQRPLAGFPWLHEEFIVAFMDDRVSKYNQAKAEAACQLVQLLLGGGQCHVSDIAMVMPCAAQAHLIHGMLQGFLQITGPPFIEVSSVNGFQGCEKEAVFFGSLQQ